MHVFAVMLATAVAAAAVVAPVAAQDSTKVVATVNGKAITEADMKFAETEIGGDLTNLPPEVKRRALAEYLIDNLLFAEAAEAAKLGDAPEFKEQLDYLRRRLLREQYFEKNLKSTISDDEARKIYNARVAELKPEDEAAARHILVDSEAKAKELRAKIVAGEDFAKVAKENSLDTGSKEQGGLLGYFGPGQMVKEFDDQVFKMQKGEVSEPVKTQFGWHIIKLEDLRRK
jgi:peptidyl-prolyl cis-trans isomerase C